MAPASVPAQRASACAGLDAAACRANAACLWSPNTRPCRAGEPCPPGWCAERAQPPADSRVECGCAAADSSAPQVCVRDRGSTAVRCEPVPAGCGALPPDATDAQTAAVCACLSGAARTCRPASDVRALCDGG